MITLFLLGKKGLESISKINEPFLALIYNVVVGSDKNVLNDYSSDIISFCFENKIEYVRSNTINRFNTKYAIAIGWQRLIDYENDQKLIVFHDSILPRLRGFNPLVTALINGDKEIGVTALFASQEYDRGAIIDVEKITIKYPIKIEKAILLISQCYARLGNRIMKEIYENNPLESNEQDENLSTYSLWRDEADYNIDWNDSAIRISRFIDAVGFPYKGAKAIIDDKSVIICEATPIDDVIIENRSVGKVIFKQDNYPVVVCGEGLLILKRITDLNDKKIDLSKKFKVRFK